MWSPYGKQLAAQPHALLNCSPIACRRYAAGALERVLELNRVVWQDEGLGERAAKLLRDIESGMLWADVES